MITRAKRALKAVLPSPGLDRDYVARTFLSGHGIEIGALHEPVRVPRGVRVSYVDRMTVSDLRKHYPELADKPLVPVSVVDDVQTLSTFADGSTDFVIANHLLEHAQDPIGAVQAMYRVVRPGGVVFIALPDKRYSFDSKRPVTPWEHLLRDHEDGGANSRMDHFREWAGFVENVPAEELDARVTLLAETDYSIHFHVWTYRDMAEMMLRLSDMLGFVIELFVRVGDEVIMVIRKPVAGA